MTKSLFGSCKSFGQLYHAYGTGTIIIGAIVYNRVAAVAYVVVVGGNYQVLVFQVGAG